MTKRSRHHYPTGRNLPTRFSSYSPSHKSALPPQPPMDDLDQLQPKPAKKLFKRFIIIFLLMLIIASAFIFAWDARNISTASQKLFGSGSLFDLLGGGSAKGSERGRINILLVGYSIDDPGHPGANLTDSIILLSMNLNENNGYMLSIPRDLYVNIPSHGYAKINEAYTDGSINLLEQIISTNFQTPIDYYALINYATVRETVSALGGITVNINSRDPRGLYDPNISPVDGGPLNLSNGQQSLDGQTALNLTRARGDAYGSYGFAQADFDRTQHQRLVLTAIKAKLNWKLILNPVKNQQILNAVANNVRTDIKAYEVRSIFGTFNSIPQSNLKSLSLRDFNGTNYLSSYQTPYGQSALIPAAGLNDYSAINAALTQLNQ
ncbi:LCP family protein [Candidatus Saccharibacteria bacterium]|nr:LCP family protein [Candidatus Saccharibacteria bacterium]